MPSSDLHEKVIKETTDIRGFSSRTYQRAGPIAFVSANDSIQDEEDHTSDNKKEPDDDEARSRRGKEIASFYTQLISKTTGGGGQSSSSSSRPDETRPFSCTTCNTRYTSEQQLGEHLISTAHMISSPASPAVAGPVGVPVSSPGYKYLLRYGWTPHQTHGLGPPGRQGRTRPVQATRIKNDTTGIGYTEVRGDNTTQQQKDKPTPPPVIKSVRQIQRDYHQEKRARQALMQEMNSR